VASRQEEGIQKEEEKELGGKEEPKRCLTLGLWVRKLATAQA
jgi:hypothetical protein